MLVHCSHSVSLVDFGQVIAYSTKYSILNNNDDDGYIASYMRDFTFLAKMWIIYNITKIWYSTNTSYTISPLYYKDLYSCLFFFLPKSKADCHVQRRIWMCLTLGAWLPYVSYKWALGLFGGSSRGAQLLVYRWQLVRRGYTVLFHRARSFGRDAHGTVREEGDTRLASQISRINPSDQWGDRCRSQIRPHIRMFKVSFRFIKNIKSTYLSLTVQLPL